MEALILGALQWRMRSITPFSFIPFFIALMGLKGSPMGSVLKNRASEIIFMSQRGIHKFMKYDIVNDFVHSIFPNTALAVINVICHLHTLSSLSSVVKKSFCTIYGMIST